MPLTGAQINDEIQAIVGRPGGNDPLIDNTRCTRWVNEAKRELCERNPGIEKLVFKNTDSLDTTTQLRYALADITVGDTSVEDRICHITDVWYLDGLESVKLAFVFTDEFDSKWPDPTHENIPLERPKWWTRRGDNIEIFPLCASAFCNKDLRFDGDFYDGDFTTGDTTSSDISGADNVFIAYGIWKAWEAIGTQVPNALQEAKNWQINYERELNEFRRHENRLTAWDSHMYSDGLTS